MCFTDCIPSQFVLVDPCESSTGCACLPYLCMVCCTSAWKFAPKPTNSPHHATIYYVYVFVRLQTES